MSRPTAIIGALAGLLLAAAVVFPVFFRSYELTASNMEPTIASGEGFTARKASSADRGDIVAFDKPAAARGPFGILVSRVVAVEGDHIESINGVLHVNGEATEMPVAGEETLDVGTRIVPANHLFVMGDNRRNSADSREFGPIPEESIVAVHLFNGPRIGRWLLYLAVIGAGLFVLGVWRDRSSGGPAAVVN